MNTPYAAPQKPGMGLTPRQLSATPGTHELLRDVALFAVPWSSKVMPTYS